MAPNNDDGRDDDMPITIRSGDQEAHTTLGRLRTVTAEFGGSAPEGYLLSDEVAGVARDVIDSDPRFEHVGQLRVGYALLWGKEPAGKGGMHLLAKAVKAPALWAALGTHDVVVWANEMTWRRMTDGARHALIAHELCHIGLNSDGGATMLDHDVEEFAWIAKRYGQWHSGLEHFAEQMGLGLGETRRTATPAAD